jgi:hypothetical protein
MIELECGDNIAVEVHSNEGVMFDIFKLEEQPRKMT